MGYFGKIVGVGACTALMSFGLAACTTADKGPRHGTELSISIPYDPYDYDPRDLLKEAQAHCDAYGRYAVFEDETVDPTSVRWRYRHYRCD